METGAVEGCFWFKTRDHLVTDGWDNPVKPDHESGVAFGRFLERLHWPAIDSWWLNIRTRPESGRFGVKLEGAGKVRVFAICNPILQTLLRPLHDWVMKILRLLPTDGTFDQLAPLKRLRGRKAMFSFDLKSATDLLPVGLSASMLSGLIGEPLAHNWAWIMSNVAFRVPEKNSRRTQKAHSLLLL